ncbi:hypothetical protein [Streptomyces sp. TLI_171]|uniref:hypothetical protein n=1 Tax=Streptomyces sp. TLI_171 TaxID=1938859 RepID=UPI000C1A12B5|nr:hypothetical protein [Streptomyces sp. TLI_171]RKE23268.1 hypothetical protein BX266_6730 [Streptomyces sp. TLI_171]
MNRPALAVAAAVLAAGALLTGCGSKHVGGPGAQAPVDQPSDGATQAQQQAEQRVAEAAADHDRAFPEVAAACAGKATAVPTAVPAASDGPVRENPKYDENHAFQQTARLSPVQQCRGDAHAARITAELARAGRPTGPGPARAALERLGYRDATVTESTDGLHFTLVVPGVGPCLSGVLSAPPRIEVHGPYLEGGCERPKGGH